MNTRAEDKVQQALRLLMGATGLAGGLIDREELKTHVFALLRWTPEARSTAFPETEEGDYDSQAPFFSECYLYNLLGKDDARTLLALWGALMRSLGLGTWEDWETQEDSYPCGRFLDACSIGAMDAKMRLRFRARGLVEEVEPNSGVWQPTEKGVEHNVALQTPRKEPRRITGFAIESGPNAGTTWHLTDEWDADSVRELFLRSDTKYETLYSTGEGNDPEVLP